MQWVGAVEYPAAAQLVRQDEEKHEGEVRSENLRMLRPEAVGQERKWKLGKRKDLRRRRWGGRELGRKGTRK